MRELARAPSDAHRLGKFKFGYVGLNSDSSVLGLIVLS
jgi:hypothetical protein